MSGAPPPPQYRVTKGAPPPPNLKVAPRSLTYQANRWRIGHEKRVMPITISKLVIRKKNPVIDYFLKSTAKSRQIETVQMQSNLLTPFYDSSSTVALHFQQKAYAAICVTILLSLKIINVRNCSVPGSLSAHRACQLSAVDVRSTWQSPAMTLNNIQ